MQDQNIHVDLVIEDIYKTIQENYLEQKEDGQGNNIILKHCPFCRDDNWKFYISVSKDIDPSTGKPKTGWWNCFKCPKQGRRWLDLKTQISGETATYITTPFKYHKTEFIDDKLELVTKWHNDLITNSDALAYILNRGITTEYIQRFRLGYAVKNVKGNPVEHIVIPHFFEHRLANAKFRTLPPAKKLFVRIPGAPSVLFNYDNIDLQKDYIYLCEGEFDAISLFQAGETNIVSITCGARSFLPEWYDQLKQFERIYIVMDNDMAGQEGAKYIAQRLGPEKCYNIILPPDTKDLNEYFQVYDLDHFKTLALKSKPFTIDNIYDLDDCLGQLERNMFMTGSVMDGYDLPWEPLTNKLGKISGGDLIYLSAKPGIGKTTLALNVAYDFAVNKNIPALVFCLEMRPERLAYKIMCLHRKVDDDLISHDDICMTRAQLSEAPIYFGYAASSGALNKDTIFDVFREARKKYGIELLIFDNIHYLCRSITHLTQEISAISRSFKLLAEELHIPVIVIAHPKKVDDDKMITANHMKDASAMHADADFVILMHRNRLKEGDVQGIQDFEDTQLYDQMTMIIVDKARFAPGGVCRLYYEGAKSYFRVPTEGETILNG